MPVNLPPLDPSSLFPVPGIRLGWAEAGIKYPNRKDLLIIEVAQGSAVSGVFTLNRYCAAPVTLCRSHLQAKQGIRALVINTGNANAGTGEQGMKDALLTCDTVAEIMQLNTEQVLPFSTGVILEKLPMDKLLAGLPEAKNNLTDDCWADAAEAIMTTDIAPKAISKQLILGSDKIAITGMSKGAGMIHPNMATMLGYLATDANVSQSLLDEITQEIADLSFNCISVDGDTSTNDSFIIIATGQSAAEPITSRQDSRFDALYQELLSLSQYLAKAIVRDGEGATKFITVDVQGAKSVAEAKAVGYAIAKSPLVKTAFFASDPNLGRLLAAIGYAHRECESLNDLDTEKLELALGDVMVAQNGGFAKGYTEEKGQAVMDQSEITITIKLNRGQFDAKIWSCDFSYDYVKINAEYRT
ncbi:bifunctional glutamate N-acetyltransferase/amino-acid acetyltransferase ArgJ [Catenovulum sp. SM1970]|uniref:bifunctional glutamate N-acetyltransferase/amino-acid acetyltransferase ArgJ n=1 Tax=Marinifaba aquimaris TaxID=2741323 RepID=UPI00157476DB|nr:bifunctional glutamate N-acetyltransferase/amino-acid acetyltransferase ArgJ [Marinifaba aquimaris]NTS77559.1 bifunctional glutamate N-acetyltransferase/amino-acid acetyltransferase ArgJ [Marinifaba aquimaris]